MAFATGNWSVGGVLVLIEGVDWRFTNSAKLPLRLRFEDAPVTFPRGRARVFARVYRQINREKVNPDNLSIFGN